jgi:hypothetical protein
MLVVGGLGAIWSFESKFANQTLSKLRIFFNVEKVLKKLPWSGVTYANQRFITYKKFMFEYMGVKLQKWLLAT